MPPLEVSRTNQRRKIQKTGRIGATESAGETIGTKRTIKNIGKPEIIPGEIPASRRLRGIIKISDPAIIEQIAESDLLD
jgi:hypothetical protein